jgi:DNA-binding NarL/FixJ family response regulator
VVQEASTNTVVHTVGAKATVTVEYGIDVVAEAADGAEAVEAVRRTRPDVVLMDILTTFDLDDLVYAALSAGANGFLLKDVTPEHCRMCAAAVAQLDTGQRQAVPVAQLDDRAVPARRRVPAGNSRFVSTVM